MNAVCCPHPGVNGSDDYAEVVCCRCDGNTCDAMSPEQQAEHDAFMAQFDPQVQHYTALADVLVQQVEEYEAVHPKGAPCFDVALESMRQRAAS